jgi:hypothetical protein
MKNSTSGLRIELNGWLKRLEREHATAVRNKIFWSRLQMALADAKQ